MFVMPARPQELPRRRSSPQQAWVPDYRYGGRQQLARPRTRQPPHRVQLGSAVASAASRAASAASSQAEAVASAHMTPCSSQGQQRCVGGARAPLVLQVAPQLAVLVLVMRVAVGWMSPSSARRLRGAGAKPCAARADSHSFRQRGVSQATGPIPLPSASLLLLLLLLLGAPLLLPLLRATCCWSGSSSAGSAAAGRR